MHCTQNSVMVKPATFFLYDLYTYTCLAQCELRDLLEFGLVLLVSVL